MKYIDKYELIVKEDSLKITIKNTFHALEFFQLNGDIANHIQNSSLWENPYYIEFNLRLVELEIPMPHYYHITIALNSLFQHLFLTTGLMYIKIISPIKDKSLHKFLNLITAPLNVVSTIEKNIIILKCKNI